ncbi:MULTISPECIES: DUF1176 domain-containing protein [unclassified Xanthomonas]|uniref:DUF1176 domain-containing protein n=1 Tax=unclassified Xanthomonas TaxID=2643310 RepID=UPI002883145B|nr:MULTISPECIES: DUF1176 domain-containing protein [unclassified Xanthomonas]
MRINLIAAALILSPGAALAAASATGIDFSHKDWTIACDNTRTCRAAGYQPEDTEPAVSVLLTRKAGAAQPVTAQLKIGQLKQATAPSTLTLSIGKRDLGPLNLQGATGSATLSAAQTSALLTALTGESAAIVAVGNDGRRWQLSDQGASAVLLKMDEFQGRLGTRGALVRKGKGNESAVLPALPAPQVQVAKLAAAQPGDAKLARLPALYAALKTALPANEQCQALEPGGAQEPLNIARLSNDKLLVSAACTLGAYNLGMGYWVVNARAPFAPVLVTLQGTDLSGSTIRSSQKGRGLGDCSVDASWGWTGQRFVQTAKSNSGLCRGIAGGAWQLPTLVTAVKK